MKVAVIVRKSDLFKVPIVTGVIGHPNATELADIDSYLRSRGEEVINDFIRRYPEFNRDTTVWDVSIQEVVF